MVAKPEYSSSLLGGTPGSNRYVLAAKAIYGLSKNRLPELFSLGLEGSLIAKIITEISDQKFAELDFSDLSVLLYAKEDSVRKACVLKLLKSAHKERLSEILLKYVGGDGTYYYNVIHWLDFGISAPRNIVLRAAGRLISGIQSGL